MRNYSPANWGVVAQSARRAYLWVCPTVGLWHRSSGHAAR